MNINVHVSRSPCALALDLPARGLDALVRASVHYYSDESEVERLFGRGGLARFAVFESLSFRSQRSNLVPSGPPWRDIAATPFGRLAVTSQIERSPL